jgi:hypothetical protein
VKQCSTLGLACTNALQDGKWNDVLMMGILADEWRTEKTRDETFAEPTVDCNSLSPAFGASLSMGE